MANVSLTGLFKAFDQVKKAIHAAQQPDGSARFTEVQQSVYETGDRKDDRVVAALVMEYGHDVVYRSSCGNVERVEREPPEKLDPSQVKGVLDAILEAKKKVVAADRDDNYEIDRDEAETFRFSNSLGELMLHNVFFHSSCG